MGGLITIGILLAIIIWQVTQKWSIEADYLGRTSSLKLRLKDKEREIEELKRRIEILENPPDFDLLGN